MCGMATTRITAEDVSKMIGHWLRCPPNGYLGSRYGSDVKSILQSPMAAGLADGVIAKAREDVPMLQAADPSAVNIYSYDRSMDQKVIVFEIGDQFVESDGGESYSAQNGKNFSLEADALSLTGGLTQDIVTKLHNLLHVVMPSKDYW